MKSCLYVQTSPAGNVGGAARSLIGIAEQLPSVGWLPHVVITEGSDPIDLMRKRNIAVTPYPLHDLNFRDPVGVLRDVASWFRLLRRVRPTLIHENTFGESLAFSYVPNMLGIPYVSHMRFPPGEGEIGYTLRRVPFPKAMIYNSHAMRARYEGEVMALAPATRNVVLHNAIDFSEFPALEPLPGPPYRIGIIANLAPYKGHEHFLRIAARLSGLRSDLEFVCAGGHAGDPTTLARLEKRAHEFGIANRVRFLGFCPNISTVFSQIHILIHPARFEAFGRVVAESLASGRPVVASREGGLPEIVDDGETGFLVEPENTDGFVAAVLKLIGDDTLRTRMGHLGAERARSRFSIQRHVEGLAKIYEQVTAPPPKSKVE